MDIASRDAPYGSKLHDLGRIDEPLLICGGAYSNLEALSALLDTARKRGIPPERIIHTGDVVAYCADPAATAELLRNSGAHAIQGNVEASLSVNQADCGCGFDDGSFCEKLSGQWFDFTDARIDADARQWMGSLPHHLNFEMSGKHVRVVHGAMEAINRFMFASRPDKDFEAGFISAKADMIIAGHSGLPFTRAVGQRIWHNSGALGLPANDATPRVWYSVLTPEKGGLRIEAHALDYDFEAARAKMAEAEISPEYAQALSSGLWPSLDILPTVEKAATGTPLESNQSLFIESAASVSG